MTDDKKTFVFPQSVNKRWKSQNKSLNKRKNNNMKKDKNITTQECNIQLMPQTVSDSDISALFAGVLEVVRKKFELDNKKEIIAVNLNVERLSRELKEKQAECNRLKNEILYLRSQLKNSSNAPK